MTDLLDNARVRFSGPMAVTLSSTAHVINAGQWQVPPASKKTKKAPSLAELKATLSASGDALAKAKSNAMKLTGRPHL
jgi:hypothetical protein